MNEELYLHTMSIPEEELFRSNEKLKFIPSAENSKGKAESRYITDRKHKLIAKYKEQLKEGDILWIEISDKNGDTVEIISPKDKFKNSSSGEEYIENDYRPKLDTLSRSQKEDIIKQEMLDEQKLVEEHYNIKLQLTKERFKVKINWAGMTPEERAEMIEERRIKIEKENKNITRRKAYSKRRDKFDKSNYKLEEQVCNIKEKNPEYKLKQISEIVGSCISNVRMILKKYNLPTKAPNKHKKRNKNDESI